ncbi:hypothetical protein QF037_000459 [Streptomyces canus]|nr:hypothetical protein [Streptomyces canus]
MAQAPTQGALEMLVIGKTVLASGPRHNSDQMPSTGLTSGA